MSKILIAYFSRRGANYLAGQIVDLPIGNTEVLAGKIQQMTGGDRFEIRTVKPYPSEYRETTKQAQQELSAAARPELAELPTDIGAYDCVILGYPNWCGTMPMPVCTFLESFDFSGKRILPFCTHEGSGLASSERDLKALCPSATVLPGLAVRGGEAVYADQAVQDWLEKAGVLE